MSSTLHIIPGPSVRNESDTYEVKWCFSCRKYLKHRWVVLSDSEPSYYDPIGIWECPDCGRDKTAFGDY